MAQQPKTEQTRHVTLGFIASGDTRKPRTVRLMVQDRDFNVLSLVDFNEHDFVALMAGQSVQVEAEI